MLLCFVCALCVHALCVLCVCFVCVLCVCSYMLYVCALCVRCALSVCLTPADYSNANNAGQSVHQVEDTIKKDGL